MKNIHRHAVTSGRKYYTARQASDMQEPLRNAFPYDDPPELPEAFQDEHRAVLKARQALSDDQRMEAADTRWSWTVLTCVAILVVIVVMCLRATR